MVRLNSNSVTLGQLRYINLVPNLFIRYVKIFVCV